MMVLYWCVSRCTETGKPEEMFAKTALQRDDKKKRQKTG